MITRNVFMKFKVEFQEETEMDEIMSESKKVLSKVAGIQSFKISLPADLVSRKAWDLSLTVVFKDMSALELYRLDAFHRQYVDEFLKPKLEVIKAWNFS